MRRIFPDGNESATRRTWRKNTARRLHRRRTGHAAAGQVPVCSSFDVSWTSLIYTYSGPFAYQFGLAPGLPERNCCLGRGIVCILRPGKLAQPVRLPLTSIREMSDSNLSQGTDYLGRFFFPWFYSFSPGKSQDRTGNVGMTEPFHILFNSLLPSHSVIWSLYCEILTAPFNK